MYLIKPAFRFGYLSHSSGEPAHAAQSRRTPYGNNCQSSVTGQDGYKINECAFKLRVNITMGLG